MYHSRIQGILTWCRGYRDQPGGSSRKRLFHCTSVELTPAIAPNVGYSGTQFIRVGVCVRANPWKTIKNYKHKAHQASFYYINIMKILSLPTEGRASIISENWRGTHTYAHKLSLHVPCARSWHSVSHDPCFKTCGYIQTELFPINTCIWYIIMPAKTDVWCVDFLKYFMLEYILTAWFGICKWTRM